MKKKIVCAIILVVVVVLVSLSLYRLGDRRITITLNRKPAAGMSLTRLPSLEQIQLDKNGTARLNWGLWEKHPHFTFRSEQDRNWAMRLPSWGRRTYEISQNTITTTTTYDFGFYKQVTTVKQVDMQQFAADELQPIAK